MCKILHKVCKENFRTVETILKIKKLMLLNVFQELGQLLLDHLIEAGIAVGSFLLGLLSRQKKNK